MQWPRAPVWVWVLVALIIMPILLIVVGEIRGFVRRRVGRLTHFKTLDSARSERIMLDVEIPQSFSTKEEMFESLGGITAPGYGYSGNMLIQPDGSTLWLQSVEIPGRGKDRCLVFREVGGKFTKCDDFVYDTNTYVIADVRCDGDRLSYVDRTGRPVPVTRIRPP